MNESSSLTNERKSGEKSTIWGVVPAAGVGRRMGLSVPKQYLCIQNKTLLDITLTQMLSSNMFTHIVVVLAENDIDFRALSVSTAHSVSSTVGGAERSDSVRNGIRYLKTELNAQDNDWICVHDAARPCVSISSLHKLRDAVLKSGRGGILAAPVSDTLKRVGEDGLIESTVPRETIWQAHTPQMFQLACLEKALVNAAENDVVITDEASAIEYMGQPSQIVLDRRDNIKITHPDDLALAEQILLAQTRDI